jgi:two-component sensor histidine kinase
MARAFVRTCWSGLENADTIDAIALCVSELVTNALDHATPPYELRVARDCGRLRVEVADATARPPVLKPLSLTAHRGRGIFLVERIATKWGVEPTTAGKTVWAEFETAD